MAQRLTPIIGLAVAAALALAAVFGLVGLTPAYAGVETPDSRGLSETGFTAQSSQTVVQRYNALEAPTGTDAATGTAPIVVDVDSDTAGDQLGQPINLWLPVGGTATVDLNDLFVDGNDATVPNITWYAIETLPDGTANADVTDHETPARVMEASAVTIATAGGTDAAADDDHRVSFQASAVTANQRMVTITGAEEGVAVLRALADDTDAASANAFVVFRVLVAPYYFISTSDDPGDQSRFDVTFIAPTTLVAGLSEIVIELEDYGFPSSVDRSGVGVASSAVYNSDHEIQPQGTAVGGALYQSGLQTPDSVSVSGEKLEITVPDMNGETDRDDNIRAGDMITVLIRQGAGITNPSEGGGYAAVITNNEDTSEFTTNEITVPRLVELSEDSGGRGTTVTATGKGFKNGTSLGFFLDIPRHVDDDDDAATPMNNDDDNADETDTPVLNGIRDPGEVLLCDVASVGSNDVGSCDFTVSNPPFGPGLNYVGAVDGRGQYANKSTTHNDGDQEFDLEPSISASPDNGNPGDSILIQMYDFPENEQVTRVDLARQVERNAETTNTVSHNAGSTGADGSANFRMTVPNWAPEGRLDLKVTAGGKSDNINITIGGPVVTVTPGTVLANQRVSVVGTGFTPNSRVCCGAAEGDETIAPLISFGGEPIPMSRINDGNDVNVDNGGNWSTSIDLPLTQITSDEGQREIVVRDANGRTGDVDVTVLPRSVTIDPPSGRVGTTAIVRGENFPSKNDEGDSFNVEITYTAGSDETRVSTVPDASGRFETEIRIPTSANIPSTNTVRVVYEYGTNRTPITTTVTHDVPSGGLSLSANEGAPGTSITVRGEGFKAYVPVQSVKVGAIEVTPSPAPATTMQGTMEFDITIPGVDSGVQTIEVQVSGTTASVGFTVRPPAAAGSETLAAVAVDPLGDNFLRAFNFNNDTKAWTFYDPAVGDASTMTHFISGNSYWILIGQDQSLILNRKTRNLTCANGSCWNLIVW